MQVAVVVFTLFVALVYILAGMAKLQGLPASDAVRQRLSLSPALWRFVGSVELVGALGLVVGAFAIPELAVGAAVGFAVMMVAAIVVHWLAGDLRPGAVPPAALAVLCVLDAWLVQIFVS
ncbi:MAG TPA: DoxX family protein [Actinomycetes bacterium]|nr:DoxX family protein [Actinomycetes bacterium]